VLPEGQAFVVSFSWFHRQVLVQLMQAGSWLLHGRFGRMSSSTVAPSTSTSTST